MASLSFDDLIMPYVYFLRSIGILPFEGRSINFIGSRILVVYFVISCFFNMNMVGAYPVSCLIKGVLELDKICEFIVTCSLSIRYYILIPNRTEFKDIIDNLREIWQTCNDDERRTVVTFERKIRGYCKVFFISVFMVNILYSIFALTTKLPPLEPNGTMRRALPVKWYKEINSNTIHYKLFFAVQSLTIVSACPVVTGIETIIPFMVMIICGYLRVLQDRFFIAYKEERSLKSIVDYYKDVVVWSKIHQNILNLCARVDRISRSLSIIQLLGTGYIISMIGIKLTGTDPTKYRLLPVLTLCLVQMYICQWAPNFLLEESAGVSTAAYFASFPCLNRQIGQNMLIIITRSQRPFQMTASGIIKLSLETYCSVVTSAISFFTVLRNMT